MTASRRAIAWAFIIVLGVSTSGCGRSRGGIDETRERAYRANNRGVAALEQFNYTDAAAAFREALGIDAGLALARVNLSLALLYAQDLTGAAREAAEAARLLPDAPQPPYILGLVARAENRTDDAIREFGRVRQMDPEDVGARINLGQIFLEQRRFAEAVDLLRGAAAAEPVNVTAAYNLGLALLRGGQADDGQRFLDRAQSLRAAGYAITYGTGYLEQGRYAEGLASTGAEPDVVDRGTPATRFSPTAMRTTASSAASPFGRTYAAGDLTPATARQIAAGLGGCVALLDVDGDDDLDLFTASGGEQRLFSNDGKAAWTDVTSSAGLTATSDSEPVGCLAGDYDNDGRADLFVLRYGVSSLYHNDSGRFTDVTRAVGVAPYPYLPGAAAMADVDHDGDLDLIVAGLADLDATRARAPSGTLTFPRDFAPAPIRLLRNNGNGTFADTTAAARLQVDTHAIAIVPTDFDNRRDVDLLIVNRTGAPLLFKNLRDGTFQDVAQDVGLTAALEGDEIAAVTAADLNRDDFTDFFFSRPSDGLFLSSDGRGRFRATPAPGAVRAASAAQLVDYDSDGLCDLLAWTDNGPRLVRNVGREWIDVSAAAFGSSPPASSVSARALVAADLNGDARSDLVTSAGGAVTTWANAGERGNRAIRVVLRGRISNRSGIGSKVHVRAGSLAVRVEVSSATPAVAPADVVVGLGPRPGADALRVLWPAGILQAEVRAATTSPFVIEELDRKPSSCPFLFTWNGERFEFVTDFMGGGEMGYLEAPGHRNTPDPVEYVRIDSRQLREKDGRLELRITNELEETLYLDRLQLLAVAHPDSVLLYPDEGMTSVPKPFRLLAVTAERTPRATDDQGRDQTERIARLDRRYADGFALERVRGYAATHALTLDLAPVDASSVLLLTAWTDYAFSSDNVAGEQSGLVLFPPRLEAREPSGHWRTVVEDIGIPVGRPQTITVDLSGRLRPGEREVRIVTNMQIYWDQIRVARAIAPGALEIARLDPAAALLSERGFSAEVRPDGQAPTVYDYQQVTRRSPWKSMVGRFTREGDVRPLLTGADDMFVIAKAGDEISVAFESPRGALPAGWTRTFLLMADGFSKEMDVNSASPDAVEPLPFHRMSGYPYSSSEHYPKTTEHERYRATYNTRVVARPIPSIDSLTTR